MSDSPVAEILVVDDDPLILDVMSRFMTREGYSVVTASDGLEALERVRQRPPDLILLDVTMPVMDGFTVCRRLKEDDRTALIPIVFLTGLDDREHRTRGLEAGAEDFLTKPIEHSLLRARIRSLLRIKRLTDQIKQLQQVRDKQPPNEQNVEHNDYVELINLYQKRLRVLEEQAALFDPYTPPHIRIEIEEVKVKMSDLEEKSRPSNSIEDITTIHIAPHVSVTKELSLLRRLRVFLCHASDDKPLVRTLYRKLHEDGFEPWLDEENILPGQDWQREISKSVSSADVVIVCISKKSVLKSGFVQKEIKYALDVADQQPGGVIYIIPLRLQECDVPERLRRWHWINFFEDENKGYRRLFYSLSFRASELGLTIKPDEHTS